MYECRDGLIVRWMVLLIKRMDVWKDRQKAYIRQLMLFTV